MAQRKFKGVLATPISIQPNIRRPSTILDLDLGRDEAAQAKFDADRLERLAALYAHYAIADDRTVESAERLALALATDFVPGFRVAERPRGRPKGATIAPGDVFRRVEAHCEEKAASGRRRPNITAALNNLIKAKEPGFGIAISSLRNLYTQGKKEAAASELRVSIWSRRHPRGRRAATILDVEDVP